MDNRHRCDRLDKAVLDGFIVEHGSKLAFADRVTHGVPGSLFQSRVYGSNIQFCPFCGARLETTP